MNIPVMIEEYLRNHGYDGLYQSGECACLVDDLVPCGEYPDLCEPGYIKRWTEDCPEDCYITCDRKPGGWCVGGVKS